MRVGRTWRSWVRWCGASLLGAGVLSGAYVALGGFTAVDLLIVGGEVHDGRGTSPIVADVAVRDGRVLGISRWRYRLAYARRRIGAAGRVVAPGFIDVHAHVEPNVPQSGVFRPSSFLRQGVTTVVTGNCGRSAPDIGAFLDRIEHNGTTANVATLVGHNTIRQEVMDIAARRPTAAELVAMRALVTQALADGALGLSMGRPYLPGRFASLVELVTLASAVAPRDGLVVWHIRNEGVQGAAALDEALVVGRVARVHTHISHMKASGPTEWGTMRARLAQLAATRAAGVPVTLDAYPYARSSTTTDVLLPDWALEGSRAGLRRAVRDQAARQRLRDDITASLRASGWTDLGHVRLVSGRPEWVGRSILELTGDAPSTNGDDKGAAPSLARQIETLLDVSFRGGAQAIYADMDEGDVTTVLANEFAVFGSDAAVRDPSAPTRPHPRGSGTFPRVFGEFVRDRHVLSLEEAIHKASGLAAAIFGLRDRGVLEAGAWADVVVFDPAGIADRATYDEPLATPAGIDYVIVNGVAAVDHDLITDALPAGRALTREGRMRTPDVRSHGRSGSTSSSIP